MPVALGYHTGHNPVASNPAWSLGVGSCAKGLPAMMMALAAIHDLPCVLVPGGVTLGPEIGEDVGQR